MTSVLVLAGCGSKGDEKDPSGSSAGTGSALVIEPEVQIDLQGKEVPVDSSQAAVLPAGAGTATCGPVSLAMMGALTGDNAALGTNIENGAQLAVDEHNSANANCQVTLKTFDTEGDPQKATQVAPTVTGDESIIGLVGPGFSGETKATGDVISQAGLVATTASATNPSLANNGWPTFFRGLANDAIQGPSVAQYLTGTLGYKKVCVIKDDSEYGVGLGDAITKGLGAAADSGCAGDVKTKERDFSALVSTITQAQPDAIFYAGYYAEAAPLITALRQSTDIPFVSGDGVNDPLFVSGAGDAAKGAYLSCPCGPAPAAFKTAYAAKFSQDPGVYSVEAYDLATILLAGIDAGKVTRPDLLDWVKHYDGQGLARQYKWDAKGELANALIWMYEVK